MIIGTCGFSWSGSSAVQDFLKEFEETEVYDRIEFILAFHPDGLEDLDYHLNSQCDKFLSSVVAIPRFKRTVNFLLGYQTRGKVRKLTDEYIKKLVQAEWIGCGQGDCVLFKSRFLYFAFAQKIAIPKIIHRLPPKFVRKFKPYPIRNMQYSIRPKDFITITQEYTESILGLLGLDLNKKIVLDQPFSGNNPQNGMKYYRDAKAIIVDRDPRDLYILAKKYYPKRFYQMPYENVKDYVAYYKSMHSTIDENLLNKDVLYVKFEDMIYKYDETADKIKSFLDITGPQKKKKFFDPEISAGNTQLYRRFDDCDEEIKYIEHNLRQYCYDFAHYQIPITKYPVFDEMKELNKH